MVRDVHGHRGSEARRRRAAAARKTGQHRLAGRRELRMTSTIFWSGIMGGASVVAGVPRPGSSRYPMLEMVLRSSERAAQLTQQLLAYAGKVEVWLEPANISQVVRKACEPVQTSIPPNIRLDLETADDIPLIETNAGQLQAGDRQSGDECGGGNRRRGRRCNGENGRGTAVATGTDISGVDAPDRTCSGLSCAEGQYVLIEVSDSGPGMDDQTADSDLRSVFHHEIHGRGLGSGGGAGHRPLARGGIRVSSAPGSGSAFQVLLPMRRSICQRGRQIRNDG